MSKINCCYQCNKRKLACHSECEDYISEKKALDEKRENAKQERAKRKYDFMPDSRYQKAEQRFYSKGR